MSTTCATKPFSALLQGYFVHYLPIERNLSRNTILAYRDTLKLLLRFLCRDGRSTPEALTSADVLDPEQVRAFLRWLAEERRNAASTRNLRLAAIKTFARYVAFREPEQLDRCRRIRELPRARVEKPEVEYLEREEMSQIVATAQSTDAAGLRDRALLLVLYNAGARVQEICNLDAGDVRLDTAPSVQLLGKGRKRRTCPLWETSVAALRAWLQHRKQPANEAPLFVNARGRRLTRSGIACLLARAARRAGLERPQRARRLTPHVVRHTTAMHMLQAGVDLTVISSWLGHAKLSTTHAYVTANDRMKQEALAAINVAPELRAGSFPTEDVLTWLEALGQPPRYVDSPLLEPPGCSPSG